MVASRDTELGKLYQSGRIMRSLDIHNREIKNRTPLKSRAPELVPATTENTVFDALVGRKRVYTPWGSREIQGWGCKVCRRGRTGTFVAWCMHIEAAVRAEELYLNPSAPPENMVVPVTPTSGAYCLIEVRRYSEKVNQILLPKVANVPGGIPPVTIGFMNAAKMNLGSVRTLVVNWLVGNLDDDRVFLPIECDGPTHGSITGKSDLIPQFSNSFHTAVTGTCLECAEEAELADRILAADAPLF